MKTETFIKNRIIYKRQKQTLPTKKGKTDLQISNFVQIINALGFSLQVQ